MPIKNVGYWHTVELSFQVLKGALMDIANNLDGKSDGTSKTQENKSKAEEDGISEGKTYQDFQKLKAAHHFHKKKVRKNIHRAMSPISAISGYLELMKMSLKKEGNKGEIERYRAKIDQGVSELGEIIEELHKVFNKSDGKLPDTESLISALETHRRAS